MALLPGCHPILGKEGTVSTDAEGTMWPTAVVPELSLLPPSWQEIYETWRVKPSGLY